MTYQEATQVAQLLVAAYDKAMEIFGDKQVTAITPEAGFTENGELTCHNH